MKFFQSQVSNILSHSYCKLCKCYVECNDSIQISLFHINNNHFFPIFDQCLCDVVVYVIKDATQGLQYGYFVDLRQCYFHICVLLKLWHTKLTSLNFKQLYVVYSLFLKKIVHDNYLEERNTPFHLLFSSIIK